MTLAQIDRFLPDVFRFEECVTRKLPEEIWKRTVHVSAVNGMEAELLLLLGEILNLEFMFTDEARQINAVDRYFQSVMDSLHACTEHETADRLKAYTGKMDPEMRKGLLRHCRKRYEAYYARTAFTGVDDGNIATPFRRRSFLAEDGRRLDYFICGKEQLPVLVLINAYGIPMEIWRYVALHFSGRYRIVTWETRGTLPEHAGLPLDRYFHREDLHRIMEKEAIRRADFICWCSGFKIMAEYFKAYPEKVGTISILCGYFNPIDPEKELWTEFDRTIGKLSEMIVKDEGFMENPFMMKLIEKLFSFNITANIPGRTRCDISDKLLENLIGSAEPEIKAIITAPFADRGTLENYAKLTLDLQSHDISDVLPELECPVLIINAGHDIIADIRCAETAAGRIKDCSYVYLKHATHWCLWDDHAEVNRILEEFLSEKRKSSGW